MWTGQWKQQTTESLTSRKSSLQKNHHEILNQRWCFHFLPSRIRFLPAEIYPFLSSVHVWSRLFLVPFFTLWQFLSRPHSAIARSQSKSTFLDSIYVFACRGVRDPHLEFVFQSEVSWAEALRHDGTSEQKQTKTDATTVWRDLDLAPRTNGTRLKMNWDWLFFIKILSPGGFSFDSSQFILNLENSHPIKQKQTSSIGKLGKLCRWGFELQWPERIMPGFLSWHCKLSQLTVVMRNLDWCVLITLHGFKRNKTVEWGDWSCAQGHHTFDTKNNRAALSNGRLGRERGIRMACEHDTNIDSSTPPYRQTASGSRGSWQLVLWV